MNPEVSTPDKPEQAPIETLPPSKPFWKSKILWGFVGVSMLAAFIIGGIAIGRHQSSQTQTAQSPTPTPDPRLPIGGNPNGQTYTNKDIGFSIYLPAKFYVYLGNGYVEIMKDINKAGIITDRINVCIINQGQYYINHPGICPTADSTLFNDIKNINTGKTLTGNLHVCSGPCDNTKQNYSVTRLTDTKIDGYNAKTYQGGATSDIQHQPDGKFYYVNKDGNIYQIDFSIKQAGTVSLITQGEVDQILSTFKFTNGCQNSAIGVTVQNYQGWKCTNNDRIMNLSSGKLQIEISNLGRGAPYASKSSDFTEFYSDSNIILTMFTDTSIRKEIFGIFKSTLDNPNGSTWISIHNSDHSVLNLTGEENKSIINLVKSITLTK